MIEQEIWKPIDSFSGYEVSNLGRVRSYRKPGACDSLYLEPKLLKLKDSNKAMQVSLGKFRTGVHRLVALTFIGPQPEDKPLVAHWDGDYTNNYVKNLRWATYEENFRDFMRHLEEKCCIHCPRRNNV